MDLHTSPQKTLRLTGTIHGAAIPLFEGHLEAFDGSKDALVGTLIESGLGRPPQPEILPRHRAFFDLVKIVGGKPDMSDEEVRDLGLDFLVAKIAPKALFAPKFADPFEDLAHEMRKEVAATKAEASALFYEGGKHLRLFMIVFCAMCIVAAVALFWGRTLYSMRNESASINQASIQAALINGLLEAQAARTLAEAAQKDAKLANKEAVTANATVKEISAALRNANDTALQLVKAHEDRLHIQIGSPGHVVEVDSRPGNPRK
jgi:hypothetical protein